MSSPSFFISRSSFKEKDSIKPDDWMWIALAFIGTATLLLSY
jgi:hypothetical protein